MKTTFTTVIKRILFLVVLGLSSISALAQDMQTAVLQHGDSSQVFYGINSFADAMTAAEDGDEISLSAGLFNSRDIWNREISKALVIRGYGKGTRIDCEISINVKGSGLKIEGVNFLNTVNIGDLKDATIERCVCSNSLLKSGQIENVVIKQCYLNYGYSGNRYNGSPCKGMIFSNCILKGELREIAVASEIIVANCIVNKFQDYNENTVKNGTFRNCIFLEGLWPYNTGDVQYYNCILPSDGYQPSEESVKEDITYLTKAEISALFKNTTDYELTDDAATKYLGSDNTQVGVHGGAYPYTLIPAIPIITSAKIDAKVGEDGKLKVNIKAETRN